MNYRDFLLIKLGCNQPCILCGKTRTSLLVHVSAFSKRNLKQFRRDNDKWRKVHGMILCGECRRDLIRSFMKKDGSFEWHTS